MLDKVTAQQQARQQFWAVLQGDPDEYRKEVTEYASH